MTRIQVNIPAAVSGDFEIAHYTNQTTDRQWQMYLDMKNESHSNYCVLIKDCCPMPIMQDSEGEYREHQWLWNNATGDVLIGGLGIGMVNEFLINAPNINSVTIRVLLTCKNRLIKCRNSILLKTIKQPSKV